MSIQDLLTKQGYSPKNYARSRGLSYDTFWKVIQHKQLGVRRGKARECLAQLYRDGLLPQEHPMYESLVAQAKETA